MAIIDFNIALDQGADYPGFQWTWWQGPDNEPVTPVDLTGCTAALHIFVDATDATAAVAVSTIPNANGDIALGGEAGTILVTLSQAARALLTLNRITFGLYQYTCYITFPGGQRTCFARGAVDVFPEGPAS